MRGPGRWSGDGQVPSGREDCARRDLSANPARESKGVNDSPARNTIELEVTNYGPIVKARIDLRPLTVFVGLSNTGKSYLAVLVYALHRCFGGSDRNNRGGLGDQVPDNDEHRQAVMTLFTSPVPGSGGRREAPGHARAHRSFASIWLQMLSVAGLHHL